MSRRKKKNTRKTSVYTSLAALMISMIAFLLMQMGVLPMPVEVRGERQEVKGEKTVGEEVHYEWAQITHKQREQLIHHVGYSVSYNADWHLPNWVAWCLTDEETYGDEDRSNHFTPDPLVEGDPVVTKDYSNSGYDRGHMAPAADMKWSDVAMKECFYMTNMCPQHHSNNAGDWKDLEELGRDLARKYGRIYICCGPVVTDTRQTIGTTRKIVVPASFYKAFLRQKPNGEWTAVGFMMPNAPGSKPLMTYMHSVDELEQLIGIDLFYLLPDEVEQAVEADFTVADWTI